MEQKPKTRGRPRAYDPDQALDQAAELFWKNGFDATSLDDLSATMGMGRPSIYNAFGDKQDLFLKALQRYQQTVASGPLAAFDAAHSVQDAVRGFLDATVAYTTKDPSHRGCLMGNVAPATDLPRVRDYLRKNLDALQLALEERLGEAVTRGELPTDYPVQAGARRTVDAMLALGTRARLGTPTKQLRADAADAAADILARRSAIGA